MELRIEIGIIQSKNGIRIKIEIFCEMEIRNWNEIIGKNEIRIEIDFFSEWK